MDSHQRWTYWKNHWREDDKPKPIGTGIMAEKKKKKSFPKEQSKCTVEELNEIIVEPAGGMYMLPSDAINEVWPNVYISEESIAKNTIKLKQLGITHVLNTALGKTAYHVNTNHVQYRQAGLVWKGIEATDSKEFKIDKFFNETSEFIHDALQSGGKVLVHCRQGVSRSATVVLAYLMIHQHQTVEDAVRTVRQKREILPNPGFLQQLCDLNQKLRMRGHFISE